METLTAEAIERAVRSLVTAERTSLGIEVSTPVAYPGGDLVNVFVETRGDHVLVHDSSFAAERLALAGVEMSRHVQARLRDYAARFNVDPYSSNAVLQEELDNLSSTQRAAVLMLLLGEQQAAVPGLGALADSLQQAQSALTGQLGYARLLAENEQQEIGVRLQAPGYRFLRFEPATRRWLPVRDDPVLKPQEWPDLTFSWRDSGEPVASPLSAAAAGPSGVSASRPAPERPEPRPWRRRRRG